jgi:hypothetical protein
MHVFILVYIGSMRTTVSFDDDVLERIKELAQARHVPLGRLMSELLRRQLEVTVTQRNGIPVFTPSAGSKTITADDIARAEDEPW